MLKKLTSIAIALLLGSGIAAMTSISVAAGMGGDWKAKWNAKGELILPKGYHNWVFLGSPLTPNGMNGGKAAFPEFHNVYVHPEALAIYRATGEWPEGTILLKELQLTRPGDFPDGSGTEVSGRGYFPGARNGIDISVKDSRRFSDTNDWGFYNFGHSAPPYPETAALQPTAACASCHIANADDMVFEKFYTPLLEVRE